MPSLLSRLVERTGKEPAPNSRIAQLLYRRGVEKTAELERILALPRRVLKLDEVPDLTPLYLHTAVCGVPGCDLCHRGPARLLPLQSAALLEAERERGLLGALRVGGGKTLVSMLLVDALNLQRAVILVPSDVREQLVSVDIPRYARHFSLPFGRFQVVSYSQLSNARTADVLEQIDPDGIIADEAHSLKNPQSSRTKRWRHCMKERPGIPFVPLSGTLTTRGPRDYAELSERSLRARSPVPRGYKEIEDWDDALRARKSSEEEPMPPGALLAFCTGEELDAVAANRMTGSDAARAGFLRRLVQSPGVIGSTDQDVEASLIIRRRDVAVPDEVTRAIRELERTWSIGDEEIDSAATMAAKGREMSCGFYYVWDWPGGVVDVEWVEARKAWNRAVRDVLAHRSRPGLDSPLLVANAARRGQLGCYEDEWAAWDAVKDRPQPPTKPIWISDFLCRDAAAWAAWARGTKDGSAGNGILWYGHGAVEAWLRANTDIPVLGAGSSEELVAMASADIAPKVVALSVHTHRKGKNLQHHWSQNYFLYCPANGEAWEQALGRTHRRGQREDRVLADVALHTAPVRSAWEAALASARYIEDASPAGPQKLNYATKLL